MQRLMEFVIEVAREVCNLETVETAEQAFDVVTHLSIAIELEGLEAQLFGQRQQPRSRTRSRSCCCPWGPPQSPPPPRKPRAFCAHRDPPVTQRDRMKDITF